MINQKIYIGTDSLIFSNTTGKLQIVLVTRKNDPYAGHRAFPGGFLEEEEELEAGALRELQEETGIKLPAVTQLGAFGGVHRDPRFRTITVAHYAIVDANEHTPQGGDDAADAQWVNVEDIDQLAFDHSEILAYALAHLADQLKA
ncbi:MAG: NUDIX hydrolase [Bacteroidota bacterium]